MFRGCLASSRVGDGPVRGKGVTEGHGGPVGQGVGVWGARSARAAVLGCWLPSVGLLWVCPSPVNSTSSSWCLQGKSRMLGL